MKNIKIILILAVTVPLLFESCLKEDIVADPYVHDILFYASDVDGNDSLITDIHANQKIKIAVETDADIVSIWPGGLRTVQKKKNSTVDSLDWNGNPVLVRSDCYSDYGLVMAIGYKTSLVEQKEKEYNAWACSYTYKTPGTYTLTVVATNHGYESFDLQRIIKEIEVTIN